MFGSPTPITRLYSKNGVADAKTQTRFSARKICIPHNPECWRELRIQIAHAEAVLISSVRLISEIFNIVDQSARQASGAESVTGLADIADPGCYISLPKLTFPLVRSKYLMFATVITTVRWYCDY